MNINITMLLIRFLQQQQSVVVANANMSDTYKQEDRECMV